MVLEPGSFLYPEPDHPDAPTDEPGWAQATDRAALLQSRFTALGSDLVSGVGPTDFVGPDGASAVSKHAMPRAAANLTTPIDGVEPRRVVALGDGITAAMGETRPRSTRS